MTTPFRIIKPLAISDTVMVSSSVPEADHAEYAAGTTYALAARVIRSATHKIYESAADGNAGNTPESSPTWWIEVSPTNARKMFDTSNSTQTAQADLIGVVLAPGVLCSAVAALNLTGCLSVRMRVIDAVYGTLYDVTTDVAPTPAVAGWFEWFFAARQAQKQLLALDLPHIQTADILVDFAGTAELAVGVLLIGQTIDFGRGVKYGARVGIQSYSRKETNDFGDVVLVQRANAKRARFDLELANTEVDAVQTLLASLDAVPCLWIGSTIYQSMVVFGWFKDFEIVITYPAFSDCSLEIEGLT